MLLSSGILQDDALTRESSSCMSAHYEEPEVARPLENQLEPEH